MEQQKLNMRAELFRVACLGLVMAAAGSAGCKNRKAAAAVDPHSAEGILLALVYEAKQMGEAATRSDLDYVHGHIDYFGACLEVFASSLNERQKQQVQSPLSELKGLSDKLDRSASKHQAEATRDGMARLMTVLNQLEREFDQMKQADPGLSRRPPPAAQRPRAEAGVGADLRVAVLDVRDASGGQQP